MFEKDDIEITFLSDHPQYLSQVSQWYFNEWSYLTPGSTLQGFEKYSSQYLDKRHFPAILIALVDKNIVGAVELKSRENKNYPEYEHWLGSLYVTENFRNMGIGSKLIQHCKSLTNTLGISHLYLQCLDSNIALYEKHGFKILHKAMYGNLETTIMLHL